MSFCYTFEQWNPRSYILMKVISSQVVGMRKLFHSRVVVLIFLFLLRNGNTEILSRTYTLNIEHPVFFLHSEQLCIEKMTHS